MTMNYIVKAIIIICFCHLQRSYGQSFAMPAPGYSNTVGGAGSAGVFLNKEAVFWGFGTDYSRLVWNKWVVNLSMSFDQEISKDGAGGNAVVNTLSPSLAFGYVFTRRFALGLGVGVGLFDTENPEQKMKFNKNGSWTVGLIGVYTFYQNDRHGFDVSAGIEQGIGGSDLDLTIELGYGYSF